MSGERRLTSIKALIESTLLKIVQPFITSTTITNNPLDVRNNPMPLTLNSTTNDISTVSIDLLPANGDRKALFVQNISNSQDPVYINCKTPATVGTGIALIGGGSYTFPPEFIYTGVVSAISTTSTPKTIVATEGD